MRRISDTFKELRREDQGAIICYIMGGYPSLDYTIKLIPFLAESGADIIEVGIPFSDPIADGSSIQNAAVRALQNGTTPSRVFEAINRVRDVTDVPILVMTYYNIIYRQGSDRFLDNAKGCGIDGVIVPDLPVDEAETFCNESKKREIDTVLLAAPTTTEERLKKIIFLSSGFLYLVSLLGVTGARRELSGKTLELVKRVKEYTKSCLPLAVGFGISRPEHVTQLINAGADGVIVGSALIDIISHTDIDETFSKISEFVKGLKEAARKAK